MDLDGKYGKIKINNVSKSIEKMSIPNIQKALKEAKDEEEKLIEMQNLYLSQLLK